MAKVFYSYEARAAIARELLPEGWTLFDRGKEYLGLPRLSIKDATGGVIAQISYTSWSKITVLKRDAAKKIQAFANKLEKRCGLDEIEVYIK